MLFLTQLRNFYIILIVENNHSKNVKIFQKAKFIPKKLFSLNLFAKKLAKKPWAQEKWKFASTIPKGSKQTQISQDAATLFQQQNLILNNYNNISFLFDFNCRCKHLTFLQKSLRKNFYSEDRENLSTSEKGLAKLQSKFQVDAISIEGTVLI
jgi:hypothetical protein